jgi:two-component system chemotaxis sensor kinase CheA
MDVSQYLEIFIEETKEHLQSLNEHILILEKEPENEATINEIFRAAHSLKGMAGTMGYKKMQELTHNMENVFSEIRNGKMKASSELVDVVFKGLDALEAYLANIQADGTEGDQDCDDIISSLNKILNSGLGKDDSDSKSKGLPNAGDIILAAPDKDDKYKFRSLKIEEHEKKAIAKAISLNLNVVGLTIYIQEYCVLKGARAFMINRTLEEHGEIIKLYPSAQDLEDEKYDFDYSAFVITKETPEKLISYTMSVSEVKEVVADYIHLEDQELNAYLAQIKQDEAPAVTYKAPAESDSLKAGGSTVSKQPAKPVANRSVRVDIEKLDVLMNLVSELIIAKNSLVSSSSSLNNQLDIAFYDQIEYLERVTTNLHESVMKVRMVPIESVVNRFPRMIRDLSKQLDKQMELYMTGEETELDRTVIDEIGDPLMHLLRNAADHGLESSEERVRLGKNPVGSIYLDAYQDGNNVVIEVRDDGAGINVDKVRRKAIDKGTITEEQALRMTDKDIIDLLFLPSFSTSEKVTDVSGRGVGLDVVKTKIEALGGDIEAKTVLGKGSNFIIRLPLTLAIIQSLMVKISDEKYALPLGNIQTVENIPCTDIKKVNGKEVLNLRGDVIPIIRLGEILDCTKSDDTDQLLVVVCKKGERLAGMVVDELIGQQDIVIKSIGKYIKNHKIISGATILGNGEVALILDVNTLI